MTFWLPSKWQISLPFHKLRLVKSLLFYMPKLEKETSLGQSLLIKAFLSSTLFCFSVVGPREPATGSAGEFLMVNKQFLYKTTIMHWSTHYQLCGMASTFHLHIAISPWKRQPRTAILSLLALISMTYPARSHFRSQILPFVARWVQSTFLRASSTVHMW